MVYYWYDSATIASVSANHGDGFDVGFPWKPGFQLLSRQSTDWSILGHGIHFGENRPGSRTLLLPKAN